MGDDLLSIPIPGAAPEPTATQIEAWKKAKEELNKMAQSKATPEIATQDHASMYNMFPWLNPSFKAPPTPSGSSFGSYSSQPFNAAGATATPHRPAWNNTASTGAAIGHNYNTMAGGYQSQQYQKKSWQGSNNGWQGSNNGWQGSNNGWQSAGRGQKPWVNKPFVPFHLAGNKASIPSLNNTFVPQQQMNNMGVQNNFSRGPMRGRPPTPEGVKRYTERAFEAANSAEDRQKVQEYLKKRLQPLLDAGTAATVNWEREPLPHERNYELPTMWTPANQLPRGAPANNGSSRKWDRGSAKERRRSDGSASGGVVSPSPERKRSRRDNARRSSTDSDVEILESKVKSKKKSKQEKRAEKAARQSANASKKKTPFREHWKVEEESDAKREERARRFADTISQVSGPRMVTPIVKGKIIRGTCTDIEKAYFRLTAAPDPSQVRPLEVLELSLDNVKEKYKAKSEYRYLSSQLRSIRQDLTVQRIRSMFAVTVYEINARVSLENKDREEFNQCQSQLKLLYSEIENCPNQAEFVSYRLLYYIAMENSIDINSLLAELTPKLQRNDCVQFALKVRSAVASSNYIRLFKLFDEAPKMCPFLMDLFVERERRKALNIICKAYRPSITYVKLSKMLGMEEEELREWFSTDLNVQDAAAIDTLDCQLFSGRPRSTEGPPTCGVFEGGRGRPLVGVNSVDP
ncbi:unnamed protein product [Caenorhabditis auriculariae]|uniref:SAC3/GANP/THP3 conserved domain-containing protein n=1 Tax=Caenorhabditis auriculariae TaxID=2777116 RepID=A0A8S1GZM9_9PELO|nr:unnamed protein product [Caenorhabditis auriculariae]